MKFWTLLALAFLWVANADGQDLGGGINACTNVGDNTGISQPCGGATYVGPCDAIGADCSSPGALYSVTHGMTAAYSGSLFQLIRASDSTTMDIGMVNHVVNLAAVATFCNLTYCNYSKLYDQSNNGNNLVPVSTVAGGVNSACSSANVCAPPFEIDPSNGLPIIRTIYPTELYLASTSGLTGGTHAISAYFYGNNAGESPCCGFWGPAHTFAAPTTEGTDFLQVMTYGTGSSTPPWYQKCGSTTSLCMGIDEEQVVDATTDYAPTAIQDITGLITFDGGAATDTMKLYGNSATPLDTVSPPLSTSNGYTQTTGTSIRIGGGGDGTPSDGIFRDGIITNNALTAADYTALSTNNSSFYSGRSSACESTADYGFAWDDGLVDSGGQYQNATTYNTWIAYGLRLMRASYYGPIADLRDSEVTPVTHTYGRASSGCGLDPAAATFCAANPPCYVSRLYNQGTGVMTAGTFGNVHDSYLDLLQGTTTAQPQVTFNALNGLAVMKFSGAQSLCTSGGGATYPYLNFMAVVAERTSGTGYEDALSAGNSPQLGFNDAANSAFTYQTLATGAAADSAYHSLIVEFSNLYVDGSSVSSAAGAKWQFDPLYPICLGVSYNSGTPQYYLTGNVAEAIAGQDTAPGSAGAVNAEATIFSLQEAAWGAL